MSEKSKVEELRAKVNDLYEQYEKASEELRAEIRAGLPQRGTEVVLHGVVTDIDPDDPGREVEVDLLDGRSCKIWVGVDIVKVKAANG